MSPLPGEPLSAGEDCLLQRVPTTAKQACQDDGGFHSPTVLPNTAGLLQELCSALPIICHYFPKHITLQISCSPGADLLQEKQEDPLTLNKIKGEQRNSHKLCWCFSAALGFPLLPSMEGKNSSPSSPRADPLKQPTHMAWGRDSPARQLNFSKVTPLNKKTTS